MALALVSFLLLIFQAGTGAIMSNQYLKNKSLAYNLAAEEIEILRGTPYAQLTNRVEGNFTGVAYNIGTGSVASTADAPSNPNVFVQYPKENITTGISSKFFIPGFDYSDLTFEGKFKVFPNPPASWQIGVFLRYQDDDNYYFAYFTSSNLIIEKKLDGITATLNSKVMVFSANTWYSLKTIMTGSNIDVYINDTLQLSAVDATDIFSKGRLGHVGVDGPTIGTDDVSVITESTQSWNFDADPAGEMPKGWVRFGLSALPSGQTKLTIEDAQTGFSDIKKITARVQWQDRHNAHHVEIITYIDQQNQDI